ncbi:MAG: glutaminyl-peptide cyclotransferase [Bacteroidales bacterium]|nr:glutaminyl-peptide cyclotransferase [Bacteroidales bacterium]
MKNRSSLFDRAFLIRVTVVVGAVFLLSGVINYIYPQQPDIYTLKVLQSFPHDRSAYTQGLFFHNDDLYESCGQYGSSSFRKTDLATGRILEKIDIENKYFAEGACVLNGNLYILTWQENKCFVYDINTLIYLGELWNPTEGWGLTTDGKQLIMTDGSAVLYFLDPLTFGVNRKVAVTLKGKPVQYLNELEYINGEIWANVYGDDSIVIINPETGKVRGVVDCRNLLSRSLITSSTDVLNGIAYDPSSDSVYLTGKNWPKIFKVELVKR